MIKVDNEYMEIKGRVYDVMSELCLVILGTHTRMRETADKKDIVATTLGIMQKFLLENPDFDIEKTDFNDVRAAINDAFEKETLPIYMLENLVHQLIREVIDLSGEEIDITGGLDTRANDYKIFINHKEFMSFGSHEALMRTGKQLSEFLNGLKGLRGDSVFHDKPKHRIIEVYTNPNAKKGGKNAKGRNKVPKDDN